MEIIKTFLAVRFSKTGEPVTAVDSVIVLGSQGLNSPGCPTLQAETVKHSEVRIEKFVGTM